MKTERKSDDRGGYQHSRPQGKNLVAGANLHAWRADRHAVTAEGRQHWYPSAVTYRIRDDEGTRTSLETLAPASGSRLDIAPLFVASVLHLGSDARAISGYMSDPQVYSDDPGSAHA